MMVTSLAEMAEHINPAVEDLAERRFVVLDDSRTGALNQSLGVAEALGFSDPEILSAIPGFESPLLRWLPVPLLFPKIPDMRGVDGVIATGWQLSRLMRYLKKQNPRLFTVALMRPSGKPEDYDVVALPRHDAHGVWGVPNSRVVQTLGAPNRITQKRLASEAQRWASRLAPCSAPRLAVLLGGPSKRSPFGVEDARLIMESVLAVARREGFSLLVSTSRRSGPAVSAKVKAMLEAQERVPYHFWQPDDMTQRDNPYFAFLAMADAVLVTGDSMSMVSEAATAGKPIYILGDWNALAPKFAGFANLMRKQGRAAPWEGVLNLAKPASALMDTIMVAGFVRSRWAKRGFGSKS